MGYIFVDIAAYNYSDSWKCGGAFPTFSTEPTDTLFIVSVFIAI